LFVVKKNGSMVLILNLQSSTLSEAISHKPTTQPAGAGLWEQLAIDEGEEGLDNRCQGKQHEHAQAVVCVLLKLFKTIRFTFLNGAAVAALGMLSTIATLSDNAGGIAEMAGMSRKICGRTDALDAAGNTTATIGKGFAIGVSCPLWCFCQPCCDLDC
jgi:hypothetical protein